MEDVKSDAVSESQMDEDILPQRLTELIEIERSKINNLKYYQKLKDTNYIWHQNTTYYSGSNYAGQVSVLSNPWLPSKAPGKRDSKGLVDNKDGESISIIDNVIPYHNHELERSSKTGEMKEDNTKTESKHK